MEMTDPDTFRAQAVHDATGVAPPSVPRLRQGSDVSEKHAFLALATIRGVGQKTLFGLADSGRRFSEVLEYGPENSGTDVRVVDRNASPISRRHWSAIRNHALAKGADLADLLDRMDVTLLFREDPAFPPQLLQLARPPHWIFVQGPSDILHEPSVAIVGTRKPSADGLFLTRYVGACLGDWAAPTVSGLAAGIDQLAHEHSLRAGVPTIAILGTGILDDYPKGSDVMRARILDAGGAIVTEYLPQASYSAENFVQRNRLQAALGRVLIPAEWNRRSGTAHTVRFATQLRRPIACLNLPEWPEDRVVLETGLGAETGKIFTLPRDQARLERFALAALGRPKPERVGQLSFFDEG